VVCILARKWLTLVLLDINQVIGTQRLGRVGKDHGSSACWWGCSGSWGRICNATICAWSMVMMAMSLAVVGAGAAMFA
jgi:hypothetical protein